jgi:hypothetical protein
VGHRIGHALGATGHTLHAAQLVAGLVLEKFWGSFGDFVGGKLWFMVDISWYIIIGYNWIIINNGIIIIIIVVIIPIIAGWWYTYPSEKYESVGMMTFPIYGKS